MEDIPRQVQELRYPVVADGVVHVSSIFSRVDVSAPSQAPQVHGYLVLRQSEVLDYLAYALLFRAYELKDAKPCGLTQTLEEPRGYRVECLFILYQARYLISAFIDMIVEMTLWGKERLGKPCSCRRQKR